ncbi:hypothetical protein VTO42DRAFT_1406 [Malbranchea cinnamomea]
MPPRRDNLSIFPGFLSPIHNAAVTRPKRLVTPHCWGHGASEPAQAIRLLNSVTFLPGAGEELTSFSASLLKSPRIKLDVSWRCCISLLKFRTSAQRQPRKIRAYDEQVPLYNLTIDTRMRQEQRERNRQVSGCDEKFQGTLWSKWRMQLRG